MVNDPTITVTCDVCGDEEEFELTVLSGGGWGTPYLNAELKRRGWRGTEDTKTVCLACVATEARAKDTPQG
jgi:hypothetical protein